MNAAVERPLCKTAVGAGDDALASQNLCQTHNAFRDQFGVLHHVGDMADHARNENLVLGQFRAFPDTPLVLVPRVRPFNHIGAGIDLEDQVDNILERHVGDVRAGPTAPAHVVAHPVGGDAAQRVVEHLHMHAHPFAEILQGPRGHHPVIGDGGTGVIELQDQARIDDGLVFDPHRLGNRLQAFLVARVVLVFAVGNHAGGRCNRKKAFLEAGLLERRLEIFDIPLQLVHARIADRAHANRIADRGATVARVELGIELGKALAVDTARERIGRARLDLPALKTGQTLQRVLRPADALAEFTVAGNVDAHLGLLFDHLGHAGL